MQLQVVCLVNRDPWQLEPSPIVVVEKIAMASTCIASTTTVSKNWSGETQGGMLSREKNNDERLLTRLCWGGRGACY